MTKPRKPVWRLNVRLLKEDVNRVDLAIAAEHRGELRRYALRGGSGFTGRLYVAPASQMPPKWLQFVQSGVGDRVEELLNKSNAAVLVVRVADRIFAFPFGHGRHLLDESRLVPDFGIKTALNAVESDSLRCVDTFTLEDQTVHTRTQASRASALTAFDVNTDQDILRGVTGSPKAGTALRTITGAGSALSIGVPLVFPELGSLCSTLLHLYESDGYLERFSWVDQIRRVNDPSVVTELTSILLSDLKRSDRKRASYLAPPEPIKWELIDGFSYSKSRKAADPDPSILQYLEGRDEDEITRDLLARDRVFANDVEGGKSAYSWSVFRCLVFETTHRGSTYVLSGGAWYEIDADFATHIRRIVRELERADLDLPDAEPDVGESNFIEAAKAHDPTLAVMHERLISCRGTAKTIEVCDLLSESRDIIHVKVWHGSSAAFGHVFRQARLSAEAMMGDEDFRRGAREELTAMKKSWARRIPASRPNAVDFRIVFAVIGREANDLPFFSQFNLAGAAAALRSRGFRVAVYEIQPT